MSKFEKSLLVVGTFCLTLIIIIPFAVLELYNNNSIIITQDNAKMYASFGIIYFMILFGVILYFTVLNYMKIISWFRKDKSTNSKSKTNQVDHDGDGKQ